LDTQPARLGIGDHTGYYSLADEYPVFHVTCITQREEPIYPTTIVGPPPMEDYYMGKAVERIFLPLMRLQLPEIRDVAMPAEGVFHNLMLVSIRKSYPGHAHKVMHAIWGLGQAMFTKCAEPHRPAAGYRVRAGSCGFAGPCQPAGGFRVEDGVRRDAEVEAGGVHAPVAGGD
jgi:hypothetical protein